MDEGTLLVENAVLKRDLQVLQDLIKGNAREVLVKSAFFENGEFGAVLNHPIFGVFALEITQFFIDLNAENYFWMKLCNKELSESYVITVKRDSGLSPEEKVDKLADELERVSEKLTRIRQWCEAYPLEVFPEPDFKKVRELLEAGGVTLDCVSASNFRYVLQGIVKIIDGKD